MSTKRRRCSAEGRKPQLLKMRNSFFSWCYAGNKEVMEELYASDETFSEGLESVSAGYYDFFEEIPDEMFYNSQIIKKYGENLGKCRGEKNWTLKETAEIIGIHFQALQQIEAGERKKIDRIFLLLFCGVYQKSPEELMGLDVQKKESPMIFYPEDVSKKSAYVVDRLIYQGIDLLDVFTYFAKMPISIRNKLTVFLKATPAIHVLNDKEIETILNEPCGLVMPRGDDGVPIANRHWPDYCGVLSDMGVETPKLLNIYVSIASAEEKIWKKVHDLISLSGLMPFSE